MKKIIISGEIGWEVTPNTVREQLATANGGDIQIQLASPGGFVFDGLEIYNLFSEYRREHPKSAMMLEMKGIVASMASYLSANPAFDSVKVEDNAVFMIHNPYGGTCGDYREMNKFADMLMGLTEILSSALSIKSKKSKDDIKTMMDDESWFFGSQIIEAGFADEIIQTGEDLNKEAALLKAKVRFSNLVNRLSKENKTKDDMAKIAAHFKKSSVNNGDNNTAVSGGKTNKEAQMELTKEVLKKDFLPVYNEVFEAGQATALTDISTKIEEAKAAGKAEGMAAGIKAEADRIKSVKAVAMPGHEALVETLMFDGKTTGEQAAVLIINAENSKRTANLNALKDDKTGVAVGSAVAADAAQAVDKNLPIEERAKAEWDKSPELRAEFQKYETFLAYKKADEAGNARIKGGAK